PRLTITPGVRWEYQGPPHDLDNCLGTFDPASTTGIVQVGPGLPHDKLYSPEKADFSPRLGVAWDIMGNGKTVLRGGISRMSSFPAIGSIAQQTPFGASLCNGTSSGNPPVCGGTPGILVLNNAGTEISRHFATTLSNVGLTWNTVGPIFPIAATSGSMCSNNVQCVTGALDPNFKRPKSVQWNLDIQRAI